MRRPIFSKILLAALAVLGCAWTVRANSVQGRISDADGAPIPGVQVIARQPDSGSSNTAITREDGTYVLDSLSPGVYLITARKVGYNEISQERVVSDSEPLRLDIRLRSGRAQAGSSDTQDFNPNIFVVKLDTNEIIRQLNTRGPNTQLFTEFQSKENYYGAPYGYPLRKVELVRPGTLLRSWHASLYESHQNSMFNARSFFTVGSLAGARRNDYGASAGGPLFSRKLSLFGAWSQVTDSGFFNGNAQVPTLEDRIPRATDPAARAFISRLIQAYPDQLPNLPSVSKRHLNANAPRDIRSKAFSTRLEYRPGSADQFAIEQRFLDSTEQPFELVIGQNPVTFLRPQSVHLTETHTFSERTLGRFSFNFDRLAVLLDTTERYKNLLAPLGISTVPDFTLGRNGDLHNLGPGPDFPRRRVENRFYFAPEFTHNAGIHTLSAGALISRVQINDLQSENVRGAFDFSANFGRAAVDNFLLGLPTSFKLNVGNLYRGFRNWEHAFYLQDTIRPWSDWTFSLGLRYEVITAPVEVNRLTAIPYRADANNFAPQVGIAWNPGRSKTTLRAGYGVTFGSIFPLLYQRLRFNPPAVRVISINNPNLLNPLAGEAATERSGLNLISPDLVAPYTHVYTLVIERQFPAGLLLRAGYMGIRTFKLPWDVITNRARWPVPDPTIELSTKTVNERRPDPRYLEISTVANGAISYFDSMQISVDKRMSRNLIWSAQYTFSKAINTGDSTYADVGTGRHVSMDDNIVGDLKGPEAFDTPHAISFSYRYQLPSMRGLGGISAAFGGWRISGNYTYRSGVPYMVHTGSDAPGFGNVDGVSQERPNILYPQIIGKGVNHPDTSQNVLRREFFDTNIPAGGRGNLGFNTSRLDETNNINFAVERDFNLRSADAAPLLQFRADFYNAFNHAQFDAYAPHVANEVFGKITNTRNRGRIVQFTLRLRL
ncbi:MAG: TonB-dependent receptor [Acidobacteria bacterium]|nr:TonB-dependent receptor [Acidobacteriota bacterium]